MPGPVECGLNVITLCFTMYCSYKPPMLAMAVHNINASYQLIQKATEYVLAVPGTNMVNETLACGLRSARDCDKLHLTGLKTVPSEKIGVPGLAKALANVEMVKHTSVVTGDHILVVGRAVNFRVKRNSGNALPLLSIGPNSTGYKLLAQHGIHRLASAKS